MFCKLQIWIKAIHSEETQVSILVECFYALYSIYLENLEMFIKCNIRLRKRVMQLFTLCLLHCYTYKSTFIILFIIQSNVAYPKVSYPKSPIIRPWKFEMWLTKVDFLLQYFNKIYNKNLRYLSLWVFNNIPCMNLVKICIINTLHNPQGRPNFLWI